MSSPSGLLSIETGFPPTLGFLATSISGYFNAHPPYNNVTLEALIFTPPPEPPRILLLQRAGGADPHAFSDYWEVPRGKPSFADPTMLHAIARIVRQQTGLQLSYVATMLGKEQGPGSLRDGKAQWMRMMFMVEVAELASTPRQDDGNPESLALDDYDANGDFGPTQALDLDTVQVMKDPSKHRLHVWATEGDFKEFVKTGLYPIEERTPYQVMLEAFAFYRQDLIELEYLR